MALTQVSDAGLVKPASDLQDNEKIVLGTGNDLEIYHNGSSNWIDSVTNGALILRAGTGDVYLQGANLYLGDEGASEKYIDCHKDGSVELYHNNVKKLETTSSGVTVSGTLTTTSHIDLPDSCELLVGNSDDLRIYHDGSNSYIQDSGTGELRIRGTTVRITDHDGSENFANFEDNGACELFYDNAKKLETQSGGVRVYGDLENHNDDFVAKDNCKFLAGNSGDLEIYHSGTHSFIKDGGTGNLQMWTNQLSLLNSGGTESMIQAIENGAVELYYDNVKKLETVSDGIKILGPENGSAVIHYHADEGDDNADKWITYAHGTNGEWHLDNFASGGWESSIVAGGNGAVNLYHDNNLKFKTTSDGVVVTGGIYLDGSGGGNAANKMDDYEEGTWTPTATSGTFTTATGTYTKVGRLVTCIYVVEVHSSTSGNYMQFNGLPFANSNSSAGSNGSAISYTDGGQSNGIFGYVTGSGSAILFTNNASTLYTYANFSTDKIRGSITYYTS